MSADAGGTLGAGLFVAMVLGAWLRASAPVLLASLGGMVSERAGVTNVGLEGLMLLAAFFGVIGSAFAPRWLPGLPWLWPFVGAALGLAAALAAALLLALFHLEWGADLIVAGISINLLAAGLTVSAMVWITGSRGSTLGLPSLTLPSIAWPGLEGWPVLRMLLNGDDGQGLHGLIYVAFAAVPLCHVMLFRTPLGLRLRAVGENRAAALAAGLPVKRLQYLALACSGLLAGLGGLYLSMGYLTVFQADMTAGRGFLALAAVFLGGRRPLGVLAAALLFGAASVMATQLGAFQVPTQLLYMIPPLATLLALVAMSVRRAWQRRRQHGAALAALGAPPGSPSSSLLSGS